MLTLSGLLWGCIELLVTLMLRRVQVLIEGLNDRVLHLYLLLELLLRNFLSDAFQTAYLTKSSQLLDIFCRRSG